MLIAHEYCKEIAEGILHGRVTNAHQRIRESMQACVESGDFVGCNINGRLTWEIKNGVHVVKHKTNNSKAVQKFECFDEAYLNFIHRASTDGYSFHRG